MVYEWEWNKWEPIGIDADITGPNEVYHYNKLHDIKPGVDDSFDTVLQCIFRTMDKKSDLFKYTKAQSDKYAGNDTRRRNPNLFLGHK